MRSSVRGRLARALGAAAVALATILPVAAPAAAEDPLVLRVGTTQDLDSMNPFNTALVVGFEVFSLNYEMLVGFDQDLEPAPAYAESWKVSDDGLTYTFKIPAGKLWSDGEPATSEDARFSYQLILDAKAADASTGLGYLDPYLVDTGVAEVSAPDPETFVVTLAAPNERILKTFVPIVPAHIWKDQSYETISDFQNEPPVVGSGPYQAVEWQTGQSVRFARNPNFSGPQGAADEIVLQFYADAADTMVQALQNGELDYARGVSADQFDALKDQPNIVTVAGTANGFTELGFNTYGTGTGKAIDGGGPSTAALLDTAFRDALGYAIDKDVLVEKVLGGYGEAGTTMVPPFQTYWHTEPSTVRTFDMDEAKRRLEAAGYAVDGSGARLDKEGKAIVLDLVFPDSDPNYPKAAEFITAWFAELGIVVNSQQYDSDTLIDLMLPPEAGDYTADYDLFIWGWTGDVDPNSLMNILMCDQIGNLSDSQWCNATYDELYQKQNSATTSEERKGFMDQMQQIMYAEAPYHILFYDSNLDVYRTDRFGNWLNQPASNGVPLFGYGPFAYTHLEVASAATPEPSVAPSEGAATPAPSASGEAAPASSGDSTPIIIGAVAVIIVVLVGIVLSRRGKAASDEE